MRYQKDWLRFRQINDNKKTFDVAAKAKFATICNRNFKVTNNNTNSLWSIESY